MSVELVIMLHPNGKTFIETASLVAWFKEHANDHVEEDAKLLKIVYETCAEVISRMVDSGMMGKPTATNRRIISEEVYEAENKKGTVQ